MVKIEDDVLDEFEEEVKPFWEWFIIPKLKTKMHESVKSLKIRTCKFFMKNHHLTSKITVKTKVVNRRPQSKYNTKLPKNWR